MSFWCFLVRVSHSRARVMAKQKKYDIFLSYSQKDRLWVSEFVSALRESGITEWFNVQDLRPGGRWQEKIQEALRQSSTLVVILSPNSVDSPWTFFELGAAIADEKRIIPVLCEDIEIKRIPLLLSHLQFLKESSASVAGERVAEVLGKEKSEKVF
jgi:hypothetical protein